VPADAKGVIVNLTAVDHRSDGWIAVYPGPSAPATSNVNYDTQENAIAGAAVVRLDSGGQLRLLSSAPTEAVIDVSAYLTR
jgi:hypothetical protein